MATFHPHHDLTHSLTSQTPNAAPHKQCSLTLVSMHFQEHPVTLPALCRAGSHTKCHTSRTVFTHPQQQALQGTQCQFTLSIHSTSPFTHPQHALPETPSQSACPAQRRQPTSPFTHPRHALPGTPSQSACPAQRRQPCRARGSCPASRSSRSLPGTRWPGCSPAHRKPEGRDSHTT
eukprot:418692-Pelagomonas_calceolata.AAC.5